MAEPQSKKQQRPVRVRSPLLKKVVADARAYARGLAEGGSSDADEADLNVGALPEGPARGEQASGRATGVTEGTAQEGAVVATADSQSHPEPHAAHEQPASGEAVATGSDVDDERPAKAQRRAARGRRPRALSRQPAAASDEVLPDSRPKPYVSITELAQLTPWTEQAIRTMISKEIFVEGKHYYHVGRRPVFKWKEVCQFIHDGLPAAAEIEGPLPHYRDRRKR
jgi:hypothetical protein